MNIALTGKFDQRLVRNVLYNVAGMAAPIIVTVVSVPPYLRAIGEARYGALSVIWLFFGYFGLFDFGLSRSTANRLAQIGRSDQDLRDRVFTTSLLLNSGLGVVGAVMFLGVAEFALEGIFPDSAISSELPMALRFIAILIPAVIVGNVFVGRLQAEERFRKLNVIQVLGAIAIQILPLTCVYLFGPSLASAVGGVVIARFAIIGAFAATVLWHETRTMWHFDFLEAKRLLAYGAWVSVTNLVSPVLASADQFLIGYLLGAASVAHYAIPFNLAQKAIIIPGALTQALFPRISSLTGTAAQAMANDALIVLSALMAIVCAPAIYLVDFGLALWIGPEFAVQSRDIARSMLLGVWINSMAFIPFCLLQGQRKADLTAKFHLLELIPFAGLLYISVNYFGLIGAAYAWVARVSIDAVLLFLVTKFGKASFLMLFCNAIVVSLSWAHATFCKLSTLEALESASASLAVIVLSSALVMRLAPKVVATRQPCEI